MHEVANEWSSHNPPGDHALQRGAHDGTVAALIAFQAAEIGASREEIERKGCIHWDKHYTGDDSPVRAGTREEYVLLFRVAFEGVLQQSMPQEARMHSIDVGDTPEALRQHFLAPDLDLPEDVVSVEVEMARHIRSEEPFHLLRRAKESSGPWWKNPTSSPILACASLTPGSTLVPTIGRAAWANEQLWLGLGFSTSFPLKR